MTRQEQIELLGKKAKIGEYEYNNKKHKNFLSYFIIPLPHKIHELKVDEFENLVKNSDWDIVNIDKKRALDYRNLIKKYIYENFLPTFKDSKDEFFIEEKHLLLRKNIKEHYYIEVVYDNKDKKTHEIIIEELDLWLLSGSIAFFVLKIGIDENSELTVNDLSIINRTIRDFRNLIIDGKKIKGANVRKGEKSNFIDWLFEMIEVNNKNLLNINKDDLKNDEFYPIFNSSYYAKFLTAVHVRIEKEILKEIEQTTTDELKTIEIDGTDVIEEMPFLLATTSEMYPTEMWEANENYINEMVNKGGINIWKYWSGVALKDSLAFFSVNEGEGFIVSDCKDINYFIYILNLYVNYLIKMLEHQLVDKYFLDIESAMDKVMKTQQLRNLYMSEEIAVKFQPNEIHHKILKGLETKELFEEVEDNIYKTYERAKDNTDILVGMTTGFFGIIGAFLSKDLIIEQFKNHPFISGVFSLVILLALIGVIINRRKIMSKIIQYGKKIKKWFKNEL